MLSADQIERFQTDGYLVVEGLLDGDESLADAVDEYTATMDRHTRTWIAEGRLGAEVAGTGLRNQIAAADRAGLDWFQPLDISLPGGAIQSNTPFHAGPAAFRLLTAQRLLDAVEDLIGPEITSTPIQHVRIKPPAVELRPDEIRSHITATAWHQDRAVAQPEADSTTMVTVWLAVTDATEENGCLQVIPGSHRGRMLDHCPIPQVGIPDALLDQEAAVPLPVPAGGAILFHPLTIHGSLPNRSDGIRWSFDLRYTVTGQPTGRSMFPSFVARSAAAPETVLTDPETWRRQWEEARARLAIETAPTIHRWSADAEVCA